ncbi:hypothetical protein GCM10027578_34830 [Spirosoma luteolum]
MKKDFMGALKAKTADLRPSLLSTEENIKKQVQVLDSLRDLIPPLTPDEVGQLEQNVLRYGIKDPLTVWETTVQTAGLGDSSDPVYILIDGHNRYRISQLHQLDYRISVVQFPSLEDVRTYMIDYQLGRRNLTPEQASYLRGMRYQQQRKARGSNLNTDEPQQNIAELLATEYGVSSRTIKRDGVFAATLGQLSPQERQDVLAGKRKLPRSSRSAGTDTAAADTPDTETQLRQLQDTIRALANGKLSRRSCQQLIQQATEWLALQPTK